MNKKKIGFNELQKGTKISKSTLSPLVNSDGIPSKTKLETLERVSEFLDVSIITLLENNFETVANFQFLKKESDIENMIICYSLGGNKLFFELEIQNYEVNDKLEYYLIFILNNYNETTQKMLLPTLEISSYNEISEFIELSVNRLNIDLQRINSSSVPIELQIPLINGSEIIVQRMSMYTKEHRFFNLPRKEGNRYITERSIYEI